eukprot:Filipodium_phascolosomae@DN1397_c0_g1_i1.p2
MFFGRLMTGSSGTSCPVAVRRRLDTLSAGDKTKLLPGPLRRRWVGTGEPLGTARTCDPECIGDLGDLAGEASGNGEVGGRGGRGGVGEWAALGVERIEERLRAGDTDLDPCRLGVRRLRLTTGSFRISCPPAVSRTCTGTRNGETEGDLGELVRREDRLWAGDADLDPCRLGVRRLRLTTGSFRISCPPAVSRTCTGTRNGETEGDLGELVRREDRLWAGDADLDPCRL